MHKSVAAATAREKVTKGGPTTAIQQKPTKVAAIAVTAAGTGNLVAVLTRLSAIRSPWTVKGLSMPTA